MKKAVLIKWKVGNLSIPKSERYKLFYIYITDVNILKANLIMPGGWILPVSREIYNIYPFNSNSITFINLDQSLEDLIMSSGDSWSLGQLLIHEKFIEQNELDAKTKELFEKQK